jgi:hypothetical protein
MSNNFFFFFRKPCRIFGNVEKYGRARQATDKNVTRFMGFACWINKVTHTLRIYVILIAFPWQQGFRQRVSIL